MKTGTALRADQLRAIASDLDAWSIAEWRPLTRWTVDGQRFTAGGVWARSSHIYRLECDAIVIPEGWPLDSCAVEVKPGGFGRICLQAPGGSADWRPVDRKHLRFPAPGSRFSIRMDVAPIGPDGQLTLGSRLMGRLVRRDKEIRSLVVLLQTLCGAADEQLDSPLAASLVDIGEQATALINWPTSSQHFLSRVAEREHLGNLWNGVSIPFDQPGIKQERPQLIAEAIALIGSQLAELERTYPHNGSVQFLGYPHTDLAWLWPLEVTRLGAHGHFGCAVQHLSQHPHYRFGQSAAVLYHLVEHDNPDLFKQVRVFVEDDRWELLGGMWTEPDTNLVGGESLVRQLLHGQRYFRSRFGRRSTVCWLPDSFGFPASLPGILAGAGIEFFYSTKLRYQDKNRSPFELFRWQGLDGTEVLAYMGNGECGYRGTASPKDLIDVWNRYRQKDFYPSVLQPLGYDGGVGPSDDDLEQVSAVVRIPGIPSASFATAHSYFSKAEDIVDGLPLPIHRGELYLEAHRGIYTSQGRTKTLHRAAEGLLLSAETAGSIEQLLDGRPPMDNLQSWRTLLGLQSHDIVTGVSIHDVHEAAEESLTEIADDARAQASKIMGLLASHVPSGPNDGVLLLNPTLMPRPARAELPATSRVGQPTVTGRVFASDDVVPPLGLLWTTTGHSRVRASEDLVLENAAVRVKLTEDGSIKSIWDHRAGHEVVNTPANLLRTFHDRPHFWDAWELSPQYERYELERPVCTSVDVEEDGPHRASLRAQYRFRDSRITQHLRLWSNSARIDFVTELDWHERRVLLRTYFPLAVSGRHATYECPYGAIGRPGSATTEQQSSRLEVPGLRWADVGDADFGVALLNNGKCGYQFRDGALSTSLLRSPVFPDPLADEGVQSFTYSLLPHLGDWRTQELLREADDLNVSLPVRECQFQGPGQLQPLRVHGMALTLGALKPCVGDTGIALRVYEPFGRHGTVTVSTPDGWVLDAEMNLLEDVIGPPSFDFHPHQIRTWRIARH